MAVVRLCGFDFESVAQVVTYGGWVSGWSGMVSGRFSGQACRIINAFSTFPLGTGYSTIIFGFAFQTSSVASDTRIIHFQGGGGNRVNLIIVTSGGNQVFRLTNLAGTTLATGTTALVANTWYFLELKIVVNASTGSVELRINGSSTAEASATNVDTGSTSIDAMQVDSASGQYIYLDDLYVADTTGTSPTNTFLGDVRIETLFPNGNGANTAWTGAYTDWDDGTSADDDTTYVSSSTPGDRETSTLTDLAVSSGSVFAVQTNLIARKDDAATRQIAPVLRIGGVNYDGSTSAGLGASYAPYRQIYDRLDPSGGGWTIATVNAMEAGVKEVA